MLLLKIYCLPQQLSKLKSILFSLPYLLQLLKCLGGRKNIYYAKSQRLEKEQ